MKIGFIDLGNIGKAMAKRLISEGEALIVWNRTRDKAVDLNVEIAENPADLFSKVQIVFISLFDSKAVESVIAGKDVLQREDCIGRIIIDTTTNHFESVKSFHEFFKQRGASYLEAPVLGGILHALQGNLTFLVSGKRDAFERALPYIEKIGKKIFFLEEPAVATKMKLINNLVTGSFMAAISEALVFGEEVGLNKETILDILSAGAGNSMILNAKREKLLREDFSPHFSSALIYKDLHYLQDLAKTLQRPLLTGGIAKELFAMTFTRDMDGLDFSGIYKILRDL